MKGVRAFVMVVSILFVAVVIVFLCYYNIFIIISLSFLFSFYNRCCHCFYHRFIVGVIGVFVVVICYAVVNVGSWLFLLFL